MSLCERAHGDKVNQQTRNHGAAADSDYTTSRDACAYIHHLILDFLYILYESTMHIYVEPERVSETLPWCRLHYQSSFIIFFDWHSTTSIHDIFIWMNIQINFSFLCTNRTVQLTSKSKPFYRGELKRNASNAILCTVSLHIYSKNNLNRFWTERYQFECTAIGSYYIDINIAKMNSDLVNKWDCSASCKWLAPGINVTAFHLCRCYCANVLSLLLPHYIPFHLFQLT